MGPMAARWWNWAQRTSNTELLRIMASMRKFSSISIPSFRYRTYELLKNREDIEQYSEVIFHNTQPNCLEALVYSVARYNREAKQYNQNHPLEAPKKTVKLINHFTDMPTWQAEMFIEEIAKIDPSDLDDAQFELHARPPILTEINSVEVAHSGDEMALDYHRQMKRLYPTLYINLKPGQSRVKFVDGPIRPEFLNRKDHAARREDGLKIRFTNEKEYQAIKTLFENEMGEFNQEEKNAVLALDETIELTSLMLGSQASIDGTLSLVNEEIEAARNGTKTNYLFVFCGADKPADGLVLYRKILDIANIVNADQEKRIKIIPLTNQSAPFIADLYSLADKVITRPGGISIMEIEAVVKKGKVFIFTELSKLEKLANYLLNYTSDDLKRYFCEQSSQKRLSDLIAWESGNAVHAQDKCKDETGRTRVVPVNEYTYRHELDFSKKKDNAMELIKNQSYDEAFKLISDDIELKAFMLTGDDAGTDLACIYDGILFNNKISDQLKQLISENSVLEKLKNGPTATLNLVQKMNSEINEKIKRRDDPKDILKFIGIEVEKLKYSFSVSIDAVKQSDIHNKSHILRVLSAIAYNFVNFFRLILGLGLKQPVFDLLENTREHFVKNLPDSVSKRINKYADSSTTFLITDLEENEWTKYDDILQSIFDANPVLKGHSFKISRSQYPDLQHDFLYCGSEQADDSKSYVLGRKLGARKGGLVTLIQDRFGENAVVKEHFSVLDGEAVPSGNHQNEWDCLAKMDMLLGQFGYQHADANYTRFCEQIL